MKKRRLQVAKVRTATEGEGTATAYATTWGTTYDIGGGKRERVIRGAFTHSIRSRPVVPLYAEHDHRTHGTPIGVTRSIAETDAGLRIDAVFFREEDSRAAAIYRAMKAGAGLAWSIGFIPEEATRGKDGAQEVRKATLLEVSAVLLPANPEAQTLAVRTGWGDATTASDLERDWYREFLRRRHERTAGR